MGTINQAGWVPYYYRTKNGAEVDLVLDGKFGTLPVEIKFGVSNTKNDLISLSNFVNENSLPFGIVVNNSSEVRLISDRIIQIPAGAL